MKKREVPKKNYFILIVMIVLVVLITLATFKIVNVIKDKNINSGYINRYVSEISLSELDDYLVEPASNTFIYLTYKGNERIYNFETKLRKIINSYELESNFIYVDLTEKIEDKDYLKDINKKMNTDEIDKIPAILYYKDGTLTEVITGESGILNDGDFQKLLDKYEIAS